jgi:hypothetical protein
MFQNDLATESVDVMQYLWSGAWPDNRAPAVLLVAIVGQPDAKRVYLEPAQTYEAKVACYDCDYDALTFHWDIRPEVEIPENSYAGGGEKPAKPIPGLIEGSQGPHIRFATPQDEGPYRLFVQVLDGQGHVGYANAPFYVRREP